MKRKLAFVVTLVMLCSMFLFTGALAEQVELNLWTWTPIPRTAEKAIAAFEAQNPDIKVNYTNFNYNPEYLTALAAAAASDSLPDIIALQPGSLTQQYRDYLADLSSYAEQSWGADWMDMFYQIDQDQIRLGNPEGDTGAYIIPSESQIINIVYNTKIFDEIGVTAPATWEDLKAVAAALTENGYAPLYFDGADGWQHVNVFLMLANQFGDDVYKAQTGEGTWNTPNITKAMEAFQAMFTDGIMQVGSLSNNAYPDGVNLFIAGKVGMMALGSWWWQEYTAPNPAPNVADWSFDSFYLPAYENGGMASPPVGGMDFGFGMSKSTKNPEAAWKLIASLASGECIQAAVDDLNNLPAFKGVAPQGEIPEALKAQIVAYSENLDVAKNQRIASPVVENALQNALSGLAAGQLTVDAAIAAIQAAQDEALGK